MAEILPEATNEPGWRCKMAVVCGTFPPVDCLAVCVVLGMLMSGGNERDGRWGNRDKSTPEPHVEVT